MRRANQPRIPEAVMGPDTDLHPALRDLIDLLAQAAVDEFLAEEDVDKGHGERKSTERAVRSQ